MHVKYGDKIEAGAPIATAYYNDESRFDQMAARLRWAYLIDDNPPEPVPLIKEII